MIDIQHDSPVAIHEQIIGQIMAHVASSTLKPGMRLREYRSFAQEMLTNPQVVARAYGDLEWLGVAVGRNGSGVFCRGRNDQGRLGVGSGSNIVDFFSPVVGSGGIIEFAGASGGTRAVCGWTATRDVYCWGENPDFFIDPMGAPSVPIPMRIQNLTRSEP